jgi:hypothetical protein
MAPDAPEPPHLPHRGSSLPRWLEWTTAISALVISICSIGIALYNANIESRMLIANSYPYLVMGFSDAPLDGPDKVERISIELLNHGVGPADERSLKIKLGGRYFRDLKTLVAATVDPTEADAANTLLAPAYDDEPTRFIASKDSALVFRIDKTPQNARYWDQFDHALNTQGLGLEFCYCSVFEECWAVTRSSRERVKACVRDEAHEFMPKRRDAASPLPPG